MNHTLIRLCAALLLIGIGLFWHKPAEAQVVSCTASMATVDFGTINPPVGATTLPEQLTYSCSYPTTANQPISVAICFSLNDQNPSARNLTSGVNTLPFELYTASPPNAPIWGNAGSGTPLTGLLMHIPANGTMSGTLTPYAQLAAVPTGTAAGLYTANFPTISFTYTTSPGSSTPLSCVNAGTSGTAPGFTVKALISSACSVNATTLDFGAPTGVLTSATPGTSTISVNCPPGITYNVGLDGGQNSGNNINARKMMFGTNSVGYQLYRDSGRTQVWGNTVNTNTVQGTGNGNIQNLTVYGKVPAQTTPPAGTYQDVVVVSVTY